VYGKPIPERHFRFWRLNFPVLRNKFSVLPKKFPVPFRREFGCKRLNLRADWGVKITDAVISGSLALASLSQRSLAMRLLAALRRVARQVHPRLAPLY
jgi:hypothetical protein